MNNLFMMKSLSSENRPDWILVFLEIGFSLDKQMRIQ